MGINVYIDLFQSNVGKYITLELFEKIKKKVEEKFEYPIDFLSEVHVEEYKGGKKLVKTKRFFQEYGNGEKNGFYMDNPEQICYVMTKIFKSLVSETQTEYKYMFAQYHGDDYYVCSFFIDNYNFIALSKSGHYLAEEFYGQKRLAKYIKHGNNYDSFKLIYPTNISEFEPLKFQYSVSSFCEDSVSDEKIDISMRQKGGDELVPLNEFIHEEVGGHYYPIGEMMACLEKEMPMTIGSINEEKIMEFLKKLFFLSVKSKSYNFLQLVYISGKVIVSYFIDTNSYQFKRTYYESLDLNSIEVKTEILRRALERSRFITISDQY